MTRMLASVADAAEAEVVVQLGADVVDLKDARRGALGAVSLDTARQAIAAVAGRKRNERGARRSALQRGRGARRRAGARRDGRRLCQARRGCADARSARRFSLSGLAREVGLVGMMFADEKPDFGSPRQALGAGLQGRDARHPRQDSGRLIAHLDVVRLSQFCAEAGRSGLMSGLAGSLEAPDVPRLLLVRPDVLGFRGALCHAHDRRGAIDPAAVALIRDLIPRERPDPDASPKIDWRLLARGIIGGRDQEGELDRVFVRDFVVSAAIGAYDFERAIRQRVVFDVEALVRARRRACRTICGRSSPTTSFSTRSGSWSGAAMSILSRRSPKRSPRSCCSMRACAAFASIDPQARRDRGRGRGRNPSRARLGLG